MQALQLKVRLSSDCVNDALRLIQPNAEFGVGLTSRNRSDRVAIDSWGKAKQKILGAASCVCCSCQSRDFVGVVDCDQANARCHCFSYFGLALGVSVEQNRLGSKTSAQSNSKLAD